VAGEADAHTGILVLIPDDLRGDGLDVIDEAVLPVDGRNVADQCCGRSCCKLRLSYLQVDVTCWTAGVIGGKKYATFEDEVGSARR
jgi:hypothetical protein